MDSAYVCSNCAHESPFYLADCPRCRRGFFNLRGAASPAAQAAHAPAASAAAEAGPRICYKCDHETRAAGDNCPRCGNKRLMTPTAVRALGGVLLGVGLFLVVFMGAVAILVAGIVAGSDDPNATSRFNGGTKELAMIFGLFGLVIAFGATSAVAGGFQLARGRRSKTMVRLILGIFVALIVVAELIYIVL